LEGFVAGNRVSRAIAKFKWLSGRGLIIKMHMTDWKEHGIRIVRAAEASAA
jgi:hypothetical protein